MSSLQPETESAIHERLTNRRGRAKESRRTRRTLFFRICLGLSLLLAPFASRALPARKSGDTAAPSTAAIVQLMVARNEQRAEGIGPYTSRRHYHVEYRGFPHSAEADLVVNVICDGPTSKTFQIVSQSGSHLLLDHVLKKLLKAEQHAAADRKDSALTPANYNFTLVGTEMDGGRQTYVLKVEPKESRALLYRGTIWVDAQDYAVVRIEAQPAKNPSFWIRSTEIHHVYSKTAGFWLPERNRSETKTRLGGTAVLTIEYGDYRFRTPAHEELGSVRSAGPA